MADLSVTYSKTPKGLRARSSFIGGLSGKSFKVLSFIDGMSKAETILAKQDDMNEEKLLEALTQLENEGYIKPVLVKIFDDDDWGFTSNNQQIVVEELATNEVVNLVRQADEDLAKVEVAPLQEQTEQGQKAESQEKDKAKQKTSAQQQIAEAEKTKTLDVEKVEKVKQQETLIKAIEKAKAETIVQEQMQAQEKASAGVKVQEQAAAEVQIKSQEHMQAEAAVEAQRKLKLLAIEKVKAALNAKKNAEAEAEQIRLMAEFEAKSQLETQAAQQAIDKISQAEDTLKETQRAELAIAAKEKIKAKATALTIAQAEEDARMQNTARLKR